ncbi:MAG: hypothetical protein ACJASN_001468 [Cyclobacteriaceae bacterium]|jgi:hypothetical protein
MRLGQLARVVELKPTELINFLQKQGISVYTHANSKLEEEHEALVKEHFDIEDKVEAPAEPIIETIFSTTEEVVTEAPPTDLMEAVEDIDTDDEIILSEEDETVLEDEATLSVLNDEDSKVTKDLQIVPEEGQEEIEEEIEIIKAPKIALPGLKVIGKIDLPVPPKKEESLKEESEENIPQERKERRTPRKSKRKRKQDDPNFNSVADKRERERKKAEKHKEKKKEREKEKKKEFYLQRVSDLQAIAEKKERKPIKTASYTDQVNKQRKEEEKNKTSGNVLIRVWRWLNTY